MTGTPLRLRSPVQTRARITSAALDLFARMGYAETTFDQIAVAARVGRRTIFRHFDTKEAILFDQLAVRREIALERLRERPSSEPPLTSLHTIIRDMCREGYDRRLLAQIREVLATDPQIAGQQISLGTHEFEQQAAAILVERSSTTRPSSIEIKALTHMTCGWFATAAHMYLTEAKRRSLVRCFDEIVEVCAQSIHEQLRKEVR